MRWVPQGLSPCRTQLLNKMRHCKEVFERGGLHALGILPAQIHGMAWTSQRGIVRERDFIGRPVLVPSLSVNFLTAVGTDK